MTTKKVVKKAAKKAAPKAAKKNPAALAETAPDLIAYAVKWVLDRAKGNTATGNSGHAAATGYSGHAAATGYYGHAAATGYSGHAFAGYGGKAKAGATGAFCIAWHDGKRGRLVVGTPGENGIKPDAWYRVQDGALAEVK